MAGITVRWRSEDGQNNATALQVQYAAAFDAVAEVDALGHRVLHRVSGDKITDVDRLVGVATIRRAVTLLVGIRHLLEASAIEPCKLVIRAQFETLLAFRYLGTGGRSSGSRGSIASRTWSGSRVSSCASPKMRCSRCSRARITSMALHGAHTA